MGCAGPESLISRSDLNQSLIRQSMFVGDLVYLSCQVSSVESEEFVVMLQLAFSKITQTFTVIITD